MARQDDWLSLEREDALALAVLSTLRTLRQLDWNQLYRDHCLRCEAILARAEPGGQRIYSLRVTRRVRAAAYGANESSFQSNAETPRKRSTTPRRRSTLGASASRR